MTVDVTIPRLAESISEATLVEWLKPDGAAVKTDEPIATLETDKAAVEIAATESGVLRHARQVGETVHVGDVLARIDADAATGAASPAESQPPAGVEDVARDPEKSSRPEPRAPGKAATPSGAAEPLSPAVRRMIEEHHLDPQRIEATGRGGRLLKEDVIRHLERHGSNGAGEERARPTPAKEEARAEPAVARAGSSPAKSAPSPSRPAASPAGSSAAPAPAKAPATPRPATSTSASEVDERVVPMSRIRQRIAERLVQAQHTAAILTTFNEIDMTAVLDLRARFKESFEKRHGVKLGFMSFFARASVEALREIPELNAEIRGTDIVYRSRVHLGVAVGTERGLVVPVVRDAHAKGFAEIEREITRLAERARDATLSLDELGGGTFTISNGGVYGSLLSTPILNPPQSGILGMHKIEKRPIAVNDQVVIRPMMYVALSYDHRIVDGEQAVTFLVRVKERLEDPERLLLEV